MFTMNLHSIATVRQDVLVQIRLEIDVSYLLTIYNRVSTQTVPPHLALTHFSEPPPPTLPSTHCRNKKMLKSCPSLANQVIDMVISRCNKSSRTQQTETKMDVFKADNHIPVQDKLQVHRWVTADTPVDSQIWFEWIHTNRRYTISMFVLHRCVMVS